MNFDTSIPSASARRYEHQLFAPAGQYPWFEFSSVEHKWCKVAQISLYISSTLSWCLVIANPQYFWSLLITLSVSFTVFLLLPPKPLVCFLRLRHRLPLFFFTRVSIILVFVHAIRTDLNSINLWVWHHHRRQYSAYILLHMRLLCRRLPFGEY